MTVTPIKNNTNYSQVPDNFGRFGQYGGKYVPETLMPALTQLEEAYNKYKNDPEFQQQLNSLLKDYVGRENPLYFAERLTEHYAKSDGSGAQIYLKREDLNHTGAHKINNALGQVLLAKRMGKQRIIAETFKEVHYNVENEYRIFTIFSTIIENIVKMIFPVLEMQGNIKIPMFRKYDKVISPYFHNSSEILHSRIFPSSVNLFFRPVLVNAKQ